MHNRPTHVWGATPFGRQGVGGIDRMMALVEEEAPASVRIRFSVTRGHGSLLKGAAYFIRALFQLTAARALGKCDVVHLNVASHGSTWRKAVIAWVAQTLRVPYVVHLHGAKFREFYSGSTSLRRKAIHRMFGNAHLVLVLGEPWREFVVSTGLALEERIKVLPNAVRSPKHADRKQGELVKILFLGELSERKGVPQLIQALSKVGTSNRWSGVIAGNGDVPAARKELERLRIAGQVETPGWVDADRASELLAGSDVLVLPSFAENLPMSVIEGMAWGLAVVTTPVGAIGDIIEHERTGLLVRPGSVDELTAALERVIDDSSLRASLGDAAAAFQRTNLEIGVYASRLSDIWTEAARTR